MRIRIEEDPTEEDMMKAKVGDRLVVHGRKAGQPDRIAEILEVRGEKGQEPFFVRWEDGHEGLIFPGSDAVVQEGRDPKPRR